VTVRLVAGPAGALCVDDGGDGAPAVLFVHSLAGRAEHWSAALEHCRSRRRAVAFDQRGHGRSAPLDDRAEVDIETLADDVRAVADACGLRRFALVGHSLGGGVALAFAGACPDRVERLLLLDPIGDGTQMPAAQVQPFLDRLDSPAYVPAIESYWGTISGPDVAVRERLQLAHARDVDDVGAMRAHKTRRIEPPLECGETAAHDERAAEGAQLHVISERLDHLDVFRRQMHEAVAFFDEHAIEIFGNLRTEESPSDGMRGITLDLGSAPVFNGD